MATPPWMVPDELWELIEPLLPAHPVDHRDLDRLSASVGDVLAAAGRGAPENGVAYLRCPVAILKGRAVRSDRAIFGNGRQEMVDLVDEGVLPADHVTGRPPVLPEGVLCLRDQDGAEPVASSLGVRIVKSHLQLVQPLQVKGDRAFGPVDLPGKSVLAAEAEP